MTLLHRAKRPRHWSYSGEKLRRWVLRRDRYECQIRGPHCEVRATQVDHIFARSAGGTEHPSNLRAACKPCNMSKGTGSEAVGAGRFFTRHTSLERPLRKIPPHTSPWSTETVDYTPEGDEK